MPYVIQTFKTYWGPGVTIYGPRNWAGLNVPACNESSRLWVFCAEDIDDA